MRKIIAIACLLWGSMRVYSQSTDAEQFFQLSYQYTLTERLSADLRSEARVRWYNTNNEATNFTQLYGQLGASYRLTNDMAIGGAYRLSRRNLEEDNPYWEHRFSQQLSITQKINKFRIRERLSLEQRLQENRNYKIRHRWRLRAAVDYPLAGEKLDVGEAYLNHQTELLAYPFEDNTWKAREHRIYSGIGWQLKHKNRLEAGIQLRLSRDAKESHYDKRWIMMLTYSFK